MSQVWVESQSCKSIPQFQYQSVCCHGIFLLFCFYRKNNYTLLTQYCQEGLLIFEYWYNIYYMISYLQGKIQYKSNNVKKDNFLIVNVNGVGYKVYVLDKLLMETKLEQEIEVFVYTQVAETALDLFGFKT